MDYYFTCDPLPFTAAAASSPWLALSPQPDHLGQYLLASLSSSLVFLAVDGFFGAATQLPCRASILSRILQAIFIWWLTGAAHVPVLTLFVCHPTTTHANFAGSRARLLRSDAGGSATSPPAAGGEKEPPTGSVQQTIAFVGPASPSPPPWSQRFRCARISTAGHSAAVAIYARTSRSAWDDGLRARARPPLSDLLSTTSRQDRRLASPAGLLEKPGPLTLIETQTDGTAF